MLKKLHYLDYKILVPYLVLCAIGVVMVFSASAYWVQTQYHWADNAVMIKQLLFVLAGLLLALFFFYFKLSVFRHPRVQLLLWAALFIELLYLLFVGRSVNGAAAWIPVGPINIQPTEFAKLIIIFYLAYMFSQRQDKMRRPDFSIKELVKPLILVGLGIFFVLVEPDTGGAIIITGITLMMLCASGISLRWGTGFFAALALLVGSLYYVFANVALPHWLTKHYQIQRLTAAIHPFQESKTVGNQVVNSLLAINHGGVFGVGLGNGTQKLGYLPEPYTDFILAVIAEELGLVGAVVVIGLIYYLIAHIYRVGIRSKSAYRSLISYGIATMMLIQTTFNVGAVTGMLPVTGVTLPFVSYGGSSMLVLSIAMGVMLNISAMDKQAAARKMAGNQGK